MTVPSMERIGTIAKTENVVDIMKRSDNRKGRMNADSMLNFKKYNGSNVTVNNLIVGSDDVQSSSVTGIS
jgi:hypothetical protein